MSEYVAKGIFNDAILSAADKLKLDSLKSLWLNKNDQYSDEQVHAWADDIRKPYGYVGGSDGTLYIPVTGQNLAANGNVETANQAGNTTVTAADTGFGNIDTALGTTGTTYQPLDLSGINKSSLNSGIAIIGGGFILVMLMNTLKGVFK